MDIVNWESVTRPPGRLREEYYVSGIELGISHPSPW